MRRGQGQFNFATWTAADEKRSTEGEEFGAFLPKFWKKLIFFVDRQHLQRYEPLRAQRSRGAIYSRGQTVNSSAFFGNTRHYPDISNNCQFGKKQPTHSQIERKQLTVR